MSELWVNNPLILVQKWELLPKSDASLEDKFNASVRVLVLATGGMFLSKNPRWKEFFTAGLIALFVIYERKKAERPKAHLKFPGSAIPTSAPPPSIPSTPLVPSLPSRPPPSVPSSSVLSRPLHTSLQDLVPEDDDGLWHDTYNGVGQNPEKFRYPNINPVDVWDANRPAGLANSLISERSAAATYRHNELSRIPQTRTQPGHPDGYEHPASSGTVVYGGRRVPAINPENTIGVDEDYPLTYDPTELQMPRTDYQKRMFPTDRMRPALSHFSNLGDPNDVPFDGNTIPFTSDSFTRGDPFVGGYTVPTSIGYTDLALDNGTEVRDWRYHPNSKESTIETMRDQEYVMAEDLLQAARSKIAAHVMTGPPDGRSFRRIY